jgi:hypothetical protein
VLRVARDAGTGWLWGRVAAGVQKKHKHARHRCCTEQAPARSGLDASDESTHWLALAGACSRRRVKRPAVRFVSRCFHLGRT